MYEVFFDESAIQKELQDLEEHLSALTYGVMLLKLKKLCSKRKAL